MFTEYRENQFACSEHVKIDTAHAYLILGLILSHKPSHVLELGLGGGRSCEAILNGLDFNKKQSNFTIVDNWVDWGGKMPDGVMKIYGNKAEIITMDEKEFVFSTKQKYDFIMSDADHNRTDQWFEYVYDNLLNENGILIYHDVNLIEQSFINLRTIYKKCKEKKINHYLFNKNSLENERCHRGLLVIFKNR